VVKVYEDDPTPGKIRISTTGNVDGSSKTFEAIVTQQKYEILDYATFDCAGLDLKISENNVITGDVFVSGNLDLAESGIQLIQGNVYATGDIVIGGVSSITGNAFANGNIDLESSASPNIDGNATAGGVVSDWDKVSGDVYEDPDPVVNLCSGDDLADITITSEDIQDFRDNPDTTTIVGNYEYDGNDNFTGIIHITGDFELTADSTFSGDVIFIVDGNVDISGSLTSSPAGSNVIFLVPNGNFKVKGGGNVTIDGTVLVGTVYPDGSKTGGDVKVTEDSNLTVNGNVIAVNGGTDTGLGGTFVVNYQPLDDSNPIVQSSYTMTQWCDKTN
jgi:cytoskeletal protein CcmA (bactofilin family)